MAFLVVLTAACNDSSEPVTADNPDGSTGSQLQAALQALASQGCSWVEVFDPTVLNFAFPDTSAHYWLALVPNPGPLGRIRLHGRVPDVRYYAFNSYNALTAPYDAIADYQIEPENGVRTPFLGPALVDRSIPAGAEYAVDVSFSSPPDVRVPNTLYSNELVSVTGLVLPNPLMALVIYRTYLAKGDVTGGAGLPLITLATADGTELPVGGGETCSRIIHQIAGIALNPIDTLLVTLGLPDFSLPLPVVPIPGASQKPRFSVFYTLAASLQDAGLPVPDTLAEGSTLGGFFSTRNTRYSYALFSRNYGSLYLVRGKAPRFVDSGAANPQLRYWSLCQNEFFTQRVVACLADHGTTLDADGYYNVVVSDSDKRPALADAAHGFNWLPWGAYPDGDFIIRNMLPAENYREAFQNIPRGTEPESISGAYFPVATYCAPALVGRLIGEGRTPAAVFSACAESEAGAQP